MGYLFCRFSVILAAVMLLPSGVCAVESRQFRAYRILILNSFDSKTSPDMQSAQVFRNELQQRLTIPLSFNEMNLEANWRITADREQMIESLVEEIYGDSGPDLVLAIGPPAGRFWMQHRDRGKSTLQNKTDQPSVHYRPESAYVGECGSCRYFIARLFI